MKEYGKWIGFPNLPTLLTHLRIHSPLLLTASCLIASRHLPPSHTLDSLITALFNESRRLLSHAVLRVPRNVETLQAILILSIWSPLQKKEPGGREGGKGLLAAGGRTLDSWLVSGYGLMLGMTVIRFNDLTRGVEFKGPKTPVGGSARESADGIAQRLRVWNHLVLIHLQYRAPANAPFPVRCWGFQVGNGLSSYCVGTRRPCILEQELIDRCRAILHVEGNTASNHDQRMVAEIFLYYKLYRLLQRVGMERRGSLVMATEDNVELQAWRDEWDYLFRTPPKQHKAVISLSRVESGAYWLMFACVDEDGHQYIEIGYWFAHLMLRAQALKLIDDGRNTPVDGSPAPARTPSDNRPSAELKKAHMSAISQLSANILQRARRVETSEIRVQTPRPSYLPAHPVNFPFVG